MNGCPDSDCKAEVTGTSKTVKGHHTTLFGFDGMGGVVGCMAKKVSKKGLIGLTFAILALFGGAFGYTVDVLKEDRANIVKRVNGNEDKLIAIETDVQQFGQAMIENKASLEDIKEQIDKNSIDPDRLKKLIKDAVKAGNKKK